MEIDAIKWYSKNYKSTFYLWAGSGEFQLGATHDTKIMSVDENNRLLD